MLNATEETPTYKRYSGDDIATNNAKNLKQIIELFKNTNFTGDGLKSLDTFDEVFIALMVIKYHLMVSKQKDYGPGNIGAAGLNGVLTRSNDKLERLKTLIGDPQSQVNRVKRLLEDLPLDADEIELDNFATAVNTIINPSNAVTNETIDDTLMDLGNYGDIGYALYHGAWGKPLQ